MRIFIHQANMVDNNKQYKQIKSNNYSTDKKTQNVALTSNALITYRCQCLNVVC